MNNFIQAGILVVPTAPLPTVSTGTHGQGTTTGGNLQETKKKFFPSLKKTVMKLRPQVQGPIDVG